MSVVTIVCSGQMGSALSFPLFENGHEVRLVGSPLDEEIIAQLRENNYHPTLHRTLHDGIKYYTVDQLEEALEGTDLVVSGTSSFGVDWFLENVIPKIPDDVPMISVTKGMVNLDDGTMLTYPEYWQKNMPEGVEQEIFAIGGPCTARDLSDHDVSFVAYCGEDLEKLAKIKDLFATDYYIISVFRSR